jgi:hypothetical protein
MFETFILEATYTIYLLTRLSPQRFVNLPQPVTYDLTGWQYFLDELDASKGIKPLGTGTFSPDPGKASSPEGVAIFQTLRTSVQLLPCTRRLPSTICDDFMSGRAAVRC